MENYTTMNKKVLKWTIISIFIALLGWGIVNEKANAAEGSIGLSFAFSHGSDWIGQHLEVGNRDWYFGVARFGNEDKLPDTNRYTVGTRVDWREGYTISPFLKFGLAYFQDEPTWIISDRWAYDMTVGARFFEVIDLQINHNSTAGRTDFNKGNDIAILSIVREF